ncbi:MAG: hypothetical protein ACYS5V_01525 [Planctomycetota bacterium]|jgi:hypothetical protein
MLRSFWKVPKAAMTITVDGAERPAFADVVAYDESPQFVYVMAATWDRPDIEAAGGKREDLSKAAARGRYLRTTVRRTVDGEDVVERVKANAVKASDEVLDEDVPLVLFAGDVIDDVVGGDALAEAVNLMEAAATAGS